MRLGWVELWATWENRSVVKAIMALASLRVCSGVGASLQSPDAFFRSVWPSGSCRDISGVSGGQGSLRFCVEDLLPSPWASGQEGLVPGLPDTFWGLDAFLCPSPSLFSPPPQGHAPSSLTPADCSPLPRARPLFPSPTWLYLVDQLEEAKWGQLLLAWPGHYLKKGGSKWRGILPTGPPPCMSRRCGLSAPLPSTCWLMGSTALAGENC